MDDSAERLRKVAALEGTWYANVGRKTARDVCQAAADGADEIERLRELFRKDGEMHAAHVKGLTERHEARITKYIDALREKDAEIERLGSIVMGTSPTQTKDIKQRCWDQELVLHEEVLRVIVDYERLHAGLEIIAGRRPSIGIIMSNAEIAAITLDGGVLVSVKGTQEKTDE
jgi:hypothetical protein